MGNTILRQIVHAFPEFQLEDSVAMPDYEAFKGILAEKINHLINTDFAMLIHLLYRLDISEKKLNNLMNSSVKTNKGEEMAELIIERQLQKNALRKSFKTSGDIPDDERC